MNLSVTLIQTELYWENSTANLAMLEEKIFQIATPTDLIILPEMFNSGFTMNVEKIGEPMNLTTFRWMRQMAMQTQAVVVGSFIVKEQGHAYNRLIWMQPDGEYDCYDKRHLFRMAKEDKHFTEGTKQIVKTIKGWRICPLICYDLRFPVWSRNTNLHYDLLIYIANWPSVRSHPWSILLQARAIENLSYVVGVNRVGTDEKGVYYSGNSALINFKGEHLFYEKDNNIVHTQILDKQALINFREQFPAHLDADAFEWV
jgi:omega-amidase